MPAYRLFSITYFILLPFLGCNLNLNDNISIAAGNVARSSQNTVNGSIYIGERAQVHGDCRTVNGAIEIGREAECVDIQTVNGSISLGSGAMAHGSVESVNGEVQCEDGVKIEGEIHTINGSIDLHKTETASDVTTINGNITLDAMSRVKGNVIIKDNKGNTNESSVQKIVISGGSIVEGGIRVEDPDKKVQVILSGGGEVKGRIVSGI